MPENADPQVEREFGEGDNICPACDGTGEHGGQLCKGCGGKGYL